MAAIAFEHVTKRFGDGTVAVDDLDLRVADGECLILVGPSGCGKSTALRSVAGLEQPTEGSIRIGDEVVDDVPPPDRDVAMVFQSYALYPHLTVERNMAFPLRMARLDRAEQKRRVHDAASLLGIEELLQRKPGELSGGQRQRVAMGRAIVRQPRAFLMDEPLSNLDAKLRVQMRAELVNLHRRLGTTTLYVTHDQVEAMTLGDRVAVMRRGVLQQVDTPQKLYRAPDNAYVAGFLGSPPMNFVAGRLDDGTLRVGAAALPAPGHWPRSGEVLLGIRPEALQAGPAPSDAALSIGGRVTLLEDLGAEHLAYVRTEDVTPVELGDRPLELQGTLAVRPESRVRLAVDEAVTLHAELTDLHVFDPQTEQALAHPAPALV